MRFATCADVHIRSLIRHDEIREAFIAFVKGIENNGGVDHIFIGGDVWHTKCSGITAEYIDLMSWLLRFLSSVADVHIILGNHDLNERNKSRQDAISPIVTALNDPRIHFYRDSGVYSLGECFNLCVYSIYDPERWDEVEPVRGEVNIACYHGSVMGAKTEQDWELQGGVPLDMFSGYTCAFLGDIHKYQVLDEREIEIEIDEDELVKFPGAVVL